MAKAKSAKGLVLAATFLLAGCVSLGGEVPDQLIVLTAQERAPAGELGSEAGEEIVVLDPATDRRLDVARVPVQVDASTVAYLKDATWVEKPARQFRQLLAESIRVQTGRVVMEGGDFEKAGRASLSGRLIDMGYDAGQQAVVVRYDAILEGGDGRLRSRRFESVVPGVRAKASAVAPALNEAANQVAGEVAAWLAE